MISDIEIQLKIGKRMFGEMWEIIALRKANYHTSPELTSVERVRTSRAVRDELHRLLDKAIDTVEKGVI